MKFFERPAIEPIHEALAHAVGVFVDYQVIEKSVLDDVQREQNAPHEER